MIYSFIGWFLEMFLKSLEAKKFINRGFLIGPYCPIYGYGALAIIILLKKYMPHPIGLFCMSMIICSILEYLTSYFMEKFFNARWWDYSGKKFNINGRVCLDTMIPFGILGTAMMYFLNPFFLNVINKLSDKTISILFIILFVIFITDNVLSFNVIREFKVETKNITKDNTEEITEYVKKVLLEKSIFTKRFINAYPNIKAKIKKLVGELKNEK